MRFVAISQENPPVRSVGRWAIAGMGARHGSREMTLPTLLGPETTRVPPRRLPANTPAAVERLGCEIRPRLVTTQYAQRGALASHWPRRQLGVAPLPAGWTINRLLHRHGLVGQPTSQPRGTPSPPLALPGPHVVHQLDLVGPRSCTGGRRFDGVHRMEA
jgi:hypothetical protein